MTMSIGLSDLLCGEDAETLDITPNPISINQSTSIINFEDGCEESIAKLIIHGESGYRIRSHSIDPFARAESVSWILKAQSYHGFLPLTAYLAVNYMDQFLSLHRLSQENEWAMPLLAVTCLSLAAKMEETLVPSLPDLQVEGCRLIFEAKSIQRMELLVLTALNWRLRLVTPFTFIDFFAPKADPSGKYGKYLISRATHIILSSLHNVDELGHSPSSIAAGAIVCASEEAPNMAFCNPATAATWCTGLKEDEITRCYELFKREVISNSQKKYPLVLSQQRVTPRVNMVSERSYLSSPASLSKRRKLYLDDEIQ